MLNLAMRFKLLYIYTYTYVYTPTGENDMRIMPTYKYV